MIVNINLKNNTIWLNNGLLFLDNPRPNEKIYTDKFGCLNIKTKRSWLVSNPTDEWWEWFHSVEDKRFADIWQEAIE